MVVPISLCGKGIMECERTKSNLAAGVYIYICNEPGIQGGLKLNRLMMFILLVFLQSINIVH